MDTAKLWQLHREGRDEDLMRWVQTTDPLSVPDAALCELLGELFAKADQVQLAIQWYCRANTAAARQALPLLLVRRGDVENAKMLLASCQEPSLEWHEANYLLRLMENPTPCQRLDALNALLQEQYLELYMTEYAAICFQAGQEKKGIHMAKKQLRLFPGGPCEQQARRILNEGAAAAEEFLSWLEIRRRPKSEQLQQVVAPAVSAPEALAHTASAPVCESASANAAVQTPEIFAQIPAPSERALPEPLTRCFEGIAGMSGARKVLLQLYDTIRFQKSRQDYQLNVRSCFHFLIRGAGGSGKTLLANRISEFLYELGAAGDPAPCILESYQLNGYLAGNGSEFSDALNQCAGRTVIVDGIAPLFDSAGGSPGAAALFCTLLEQFRESVNFILTGTDEDLRRFLAAEPAIAGMFLYDIKIEAYSLEQLLTIAQRIAGDEGYALTANAALQLKKRLELESQLPSFENGKTIESVINRATVQLAVRMAGADILSKGKLMRIEAEDLEEQEEEHSLKELLDQLNSMTGLTAVKERVQRLAAQAKVDQAERQAGRKGTGFGTLHMIFTGNAGTGKTTVARIIGEIYRALGILPRGNEVVECGRSDLIGQYEGHTAPKVRAKVAEAMGGVLFIDEAYALCQDTRDMYGLEAVNTLVAEIENHRQGLMVILAGYSEDMDRFLEQNQGLSSRFPHRLEFEDYTQEEMEQIFLNMLAGSGRRLSDGCEPLVKEYINQNRSKKGFGNARGIRNLHQQLIEAQSLRLSREMEQNGALSPNAYEIIMREDLDSLTDGSSAGKKSLQDWLYELEHMTGLESVKEKVKRKSNAILAQRKMEELHLGSPDDIGTMHMVFRGNAGTGKTTVARILGGIYNALGLLPGEDIFVECGRSDLVGEYQGHTAMKVKQVVNRAMGGVLFIDEAYALCRDACDSFGREAIDALVADMENHREELMVIFAGYSEDMDRFLEQNQGLASRVPTSLTFEDYTLEELLHIFRNILEGKGFALSADAEESAGQLIAERSQARSFGNARGVRNIAEKILEMHKARIGEMLSEGRLPADKEFITVTLEDFQGI